MKSQRRNSNDGTNMCMDYLNNSIHNLERAFELIIENNKNGKQFNYCNCPELSSAVDKMAMLIKNISDKVYQNNAALQHACRWPWPVEEQKGQDETC